MTNFSTYLYKLVVQLLLPPMDIMLLLLVLCCLPAGFARIRRWGVALCAVLLLVLAMPVSSNLLLVGLEQGVALRTPTSQDARAPEAPEAIVILGGDNDSGLPHGGIVNGVRAGTLSLERSRAGAILHRRTGLPVLVTGGALSAGHPPVATLMADILTGELATPVRWQETRAGTTWENAKYSAALLRRDNVTSVYLVTHPWHMRRAIIAFRHFGVTVWPAPIDMDVLKPQSPDDFIPAAAGWLDSYYAFHEWIGCVYYAWRG